MSRKFCNLYRILYASIQGHGKISIVSGHCTGSSRNGRFVRPHYFTDGSLCVIPSAIKISAVKGENSWRKWENSMGISHGAL